MNIIKGLYKDENGKYTKKLEPNFERVRTLMHDGNYNDSLIKIAEPVNKFNKMLKSRLKITSASSEQAHGMGEIAKAMGNIDQSTHETNHLSKKVSQISDELSTEVQAIANMIGELEKLTA